VDSSLSKITPKSAIEFPLVYEKMKSDNPEDWVGCVFICRKIFHELANKLYPTRKDDKVIKIAGTEKTIKLGKDDYINRLVAFVEENSKLERFIDITRASLFAIGEQLDDIFAAAQQGSQENIVSREEAERFVVQTYILVGDIIMLMPKEDQAESAEKNKPGEIEEIQPNAPETEQTTLDKNASKGPTEKS